MRLLAPVPAAVRRTSPPFASLLCAVDLSEVGKACASVAYALACEGGTVHLLHVAPPAPRLRALVGEDPEATGRFPPQVDELFAESRLADLVPPDAAERGIRTEIVVVDGGAPAEEISHTAAVLGADVIVAGTHGLSGFGHVLVGSVASKVAQSSPTPVLLVYPGRPGAGGRALSLPPRSILCPTDLSARSNEAVPVAYVLAGASSTVHLLHVWQRPFCPSEDPGEERRASESSARRGLLAVARTESIRDVPTEIHVVEDDDAAAAIERVASALEADLVVLSTHGRSGQRRVRMGPVASEAIRGGAPVVLVPSLFDDAE